MSKAGMSIFLCDVDSIFGDCYGQNCKCSLNAFLDNIDMIKEYQEQKRTMVFFYTDNSISKIKNITPYLNECASSINSTHVAGQQDGMTCIGVICKDKLYQIFRTFDENGKITFTYFPTNLQKHFDLLKERFNILLTLSITKETYKDDYYGDFTLYPYEKVKLGDFLDQFNVKVKKLGGKYSNGK